jgi:hypothetical protein
MDYRKRNLVKILNTINNFNEAVAKNFDKIEYPLFKLKYCITNDTFHSFDSKDRCYNCAFFKKPSIPISGANFKDFKEYFREKFFPKLIETVDNWPKKIIFHLYIIIQSIPLKNMKN